MQPLEELTLTRLRMRTSAKWCAYDADVLPAWVAELDVALAEPVVEAVHRAVATGDTGYPSGSAYAEAFAGFAGRRWGWTGVDVDRAVGIADVMTGVRELLLLLTDPGDAVVLTNPVYPPFWAVVRDNDRETVTAPLHPTGRLDLDVLADVLAVTTAAHPRTVLLLASPHNPTGAVHTPAELSAVAALAREHGVRVVVDEIHAPLVLDGARFTPYLSLPGTGDALAVASASKAWNLAGLKAALVLAGEDAVPDLVRLPLLARHSISHLGVIAQTAAYEAGEPWLDALLAGLSANRDLLGRLLVDQLPQVGWTPPEGTYLAWLDCTALGLGDDPAATFLDRGRVALSPGPDFGPGGEQHARLNFGCSAETLREVVGRMASATKG